VKLSVVYPQPPDRVWLALASADALAEWLMPNDCVPRVGHRFHFRARPAPGFDGIVRCTVMAIVGKRRLRVLTKITAAARNGIEGCDVDTTRLWRVLNRLWGRAATGR
jgi:uncharacterized protein YndB with AHSA1/START domain